MLSTKAKIRIARTLSTAIVGARTALGRGSEVTARRGGIAWRLDLREGIDLAIYLRLYQRIPQRLTRDWLKPDSVVLDIGANIGSHGLPLAQQLGPGGQVICIEPTDYAFAKLKANAALNPNLADRLILLQAALTDKSAATIAPGQTGIPSFYSRWPLRGETDGRHVRHLGQLETAKGARLLPLDRLFEELSASGRIHERLTFVKLDVDGHELEVLRGAEATFARYKPAVNLEIAPHVQDEVPGRFENLLQTLQAFGYRLESGSGRSLPVSAPSLRKLVRDGGSMDVLALPV